MICWINPFTGLAGDMLLGALLDAGAPLDLVRAAIGATGLTGWELDAERVTTHGLVATSARVRVTDTATERRAAELLELAARARPEPVAAWSIAALTAIARAEGRLHGTDPAEVHLHELGGHDALVDIVGVAAALHALGVTDVVCAPLPLGTGHVSAAHGRLPCPAPATLELLRGAAVVGTDLGGETVTPTGAALLRAAGARYGPLPPMTPTATGYGAGTRELADRPNVVSVTLGHPMSPPGPPGPPGPIGPAVATEDVVTLESNLDDVTGETLAHTIARALAEGALDAWTTPAVMKKGRPAQVLHVLARPEDVGRLRELILAETGTLGVRQTAQTRVAAPRRTSGVEVDGLPVRVKYGPFGVKAEHDDAAAVAGRLGLPLRLVADRARSLAEQEHPNASTTEGGTR
ncbi:nickel pincer cofactor biosynthesis protein LarC [Streptacidiphilus pinicola]|uniref:Pyridinium-3,5-bisthiocarboxylic acid mononucleotide nickel insertion protein n=1 Tax=Streptacidiphilus pinicola TaxID=2219663 RepID=A0A2X0IPU0_9ACTN|nr:nickel pincer cofactor biosynthesis protein LarC [Streptacidiphilus pinicola]RAG86677.1 nickel pincer cofactor biosynthesis protein LarC [Streptacidiphilus pinicola]